MENISTLRALRDKVGCMETALLGGKIPAAKFRNQIKAMEYEQTKVQRQDTVH